jgi:hypothetical protein
MATTRRILDIRRNVVDTRGRKYALCSRHDGIWGGALDKPAALKHEL